MEIQTQDSFLRASFAQGAPVPLKARLLEIARSLDLDVKKRKKDELFDMIIDKIFSEKSEDERNEIKLGCRQVAWQSNLWEGIPVSTRLWHGMSYLSLHG